MQCLRCPSGHSVWRSIALALCLAFSAALVVGCGSKSSASGKSDNTKSSSTGSTLSVGDQVVVDSGSVHTPALVWDGKNDKLYAAWVRDSKVPGPWGSTQGSPYVATSSDGGSTFGAPTAVSSLPSTTTQTPQALTVTKDGTVVDIWAHYTANDKTQVGQFDMEEARSTDAGKTWKVTSPHDDYGAIPQVGRPNVSAAADGKVWLAWIDRADPSIRIAVSRDDGVAFSPSWVIKSLVCSCCRPDIEQSPSDPNVVAMTWRDNLEKPGTQGHGMQMDGMDENGKPVAGKVWPKTDIRTVKVAISTDGGHDFGAATSVNDYPWHIQSCPTIGSDLFFDKSGERLGTTWFNGATGHIGVYYSGSKDGGKTFSDPIKLSGDIVGEGYDFAGAYYDDGGNAWVGWATADRHVQVARISPSGEVSKTEKIKGEEIGFTSNGKNPVISYSLNGKLMVQSVKS